MSKLTQIPEVEPDEFDLEMIAQEQAEPDEDEPVSLSECAL